jgi:serine/threonine protein phosphatase PrpC
MRVYQIGDSIALAVGRKGKLRYQSTSHSPVGYALEHGFLNEEEAQEHEDRHIVSNVVGDVEMSIEIGPWVKLRQQDTVIVASDGLSDNTTLGEMCDLIRCGPLEDSARNLSLLAERRMSGASETVCGKPDDLTFALFRFR